MAQRIIFKRKIFAPLTLFIITILNRQVYSCIFSQNKEIPQPELKPYLEPWKDAPSYRETQTQCVCGLDDGLTPLEKTWFIFVYVFHTPKNISTCTGTIINSKMVLTSQSCLKFINAKIGVYEVWDPPPQNFMSVFAQKDDVMVSSHEDPLNSDYYIKIKEIIYSKEWIRKEFKKHQPDGDIAILIMDEDWPIQKYPPICVPKIETPFDPTGFYGYYYGVGGKLRGDPNPEVETIGNLFVLPGTICDKDTRMKIFSSNETLCIQSRLIPPTSTGGPLIMAEEGQVNEYGFTDDQTVYLIGLASTIKQMKNTERIVTTYFSNIFPWIQYLQYYANMFGAEWCETPSIKLMDSYRDTDFKKGQKRKYIWEVGPPKKRDESLDCVCGLHNYEKSANQGRIVGGVAAMPYEFPWLVHMEIKSEIFAGEKFENPSFCGGSIINDRLILTAAHCIVSRERVPEHGSKEWTSDFMTVYVSAHEYKDQKGLELNATEVFYLRDYSIGALISDQLYDYDLALILLKEPLVFSTVKNHENAKMGDVRPICLPRQGMPINVVGRNATVAGWGVSWNGTDPEDSYFPDVLLKLQIPILPLEECSKRANASVRDSVICAGYFNRSGDSSRGDSGGPLVTRSDNGYWFQVGIVSVGYDVEDENEVYLRTVALYTNVQKFLRFIDYYSDKIGAKWCKSYI